MNKGKRTYRNSSEIHPRFIASCLASEHVAYVGGGREPMLGGEGRCIPS
jgi:hypothetical protein